MSKDKEGDLTRKYKGLGTHLPEIDAGNLDAAEEALLNLAEQRPDFVSAIAKALGGRRPRVNDSISRAHREMLNRAGRIAEQKLSEQSSSGKTERRKIEGGK